MKNSLFHPGFSTGFMAWLILLGLMAPSLSYGAFDLFLEIKGIQGESQFQGYEKDIEILAWNWGINQSNSPLSGSSGFTGKINIRDLQLTKYIDRSSPFLLYAANSGQPFPQMALYVLKQGRNPQEIKVIIMKDVMVTSVQLLGNTGEDRLTESISLLFAEVNVEYKPINVLGFPEQPINYVWNILKDEGFVTTDSRFTSENIVRVYDNLDEPVNDPVKELTGKTDFDLAEKRNLTIYSPVDTQGAVDWHIYVRKGLDGLKFLGRTASGSKSRLDWNAGAPNISPEFINGPDFNSIYTFRLIRLDGKLGSDDIFDQKGSVGFNLEGGNPLTLTQTVMPNLNPGQVSIYDDILGGNDLAPMGAAGSDIDTDDARAIQIAWNFGVDLSQVNEYHVQIKVDNGNFEFLGQTYTGKINYFWWTPNKQFSTIAKHAKGPQAGHTYQFRVFLIPFSGNPQSLFSGILRYSVQQ